jgi:hypothetical protein
LESSHFQGRQGEDQHHEDDGDGLQRLEEEQIQALAQAQEARSIMVEGQEEDDDY